MSRRNPYSAALCRGLIEAATAHCSAAASSRSIPRLYAAASLKHIECLVVSGGGYGIPRLYAAASLKREFAARGEPDEMPYSAALCRGLIEAPSFRERLLDLKSYSAALCRGLIEAQRTPAPCG